MPVIVAVLRALWKVFVHFIRLLEGKVILLLVERVTGDLGVLIVEKAQSGAKHYILSQVVVNVIMGKVYALEAILGFLHFLLDRFRLGVSALCLERRVRVIFIVIFRKDFSLEGVYAL